MPSLPKATSCEVDAFTFHLVTAAVFASFSLLLCISVAIVVTVAKTKVSRLKSTSAKSLSKMSKYHKSDSKAHQAERDVLSDLDHDAAAGFDAPDNKIVEEVDVQSIEVHASTDSLSKRRPAVPKITSAHTVRAGLPKVMRTENTCHQTAVPKLPRITSGMTPRARLPEFVKRNIAESNYRSSNKFFLPTLQNKDGAN